MRASRLELSLDLTVQAALGAGALWRHEVDERQGRDSVLMDVHTGEVISVVSLPTLIPTTGPSCTEGDASDSPLFNRSVQGVYELGSVFKIFARSGD